MQMMKIVLSSLHMSLLKVMVRYWLVARTGMEKKSNMISIVKINFVHPLRIMLSIPYR